MCRLSPPRRLDEVVALYLPFIFPRCVVCLEQRNNDMLLVDRVVVVRGHELIGDWPVAARGCIV
mgnify:CR=1 FL=1